MGSVLAHPRAPKTATIIRLRQRDPRAAFRAGVEHAQKMAYWAARGPVEWQEPRHERPRWANHAWAFLAGAACGAILILFGL